MDVMWERLGLPRLRGSMSVVFVLLIDSLGSGLFAPLSLLYFHVVAGLPLATVGLALSGTAAVGVALSPLVGPLVDRFGARRVVAGAQLLQGVGFLVYLGVGSVAALIPAALLVTIGLRAFWSSLFTFLADLAPATEQDRWYGLAGAAQNAGFGLGGLLGGLLIASGGTTGYRLVVGINAASFFVAGGLLLGRVREPRRARPVQATAGDGGYRLLLRDRPFLALTATNVLFALCNLLFFVGLPVYALDALAAPAWLPGVLFAANTALLAGAQTAVVRLAEPYRRTRVLALAGALWCAWAVLFALAVRLPAALVIPFLIAVTGLYALADLLHSPTANALAAAASPEAVRGRYLAAYQLSWGVATFLAPAFFTVLFARDAALPWAVLAVLALVGLGAILRLEPRLTRAAVRPAGVRRRDQAEIQQPTR